MGRAAEFLERAGRGSVSPDGEWEMNFGPIRRASGLLTVSYSRGAGGFGYFMSRHPSSTKPLSYRICTRGAENYEYVEVQHSDFRGEVNSIYLADNPAAGQGRASISLSRPELDIFEKLFEEQLQNFADGLPRHKNFVRRHMREMGREAAIMTLKEYCASAKPMLSDMPVNLAGSR